MESHVAEWNLEWGIVCDRGQVRRENQDVVLFWYQGELLDGTPRTGGRGVLAPDAPWAAAVADGMGGVAGGAEASRAAIAAVTGALEDGDLWPQPESLNQLSRAAHAAVRREAQTRQLEGMGSTLTLVVGRGADLALLQIGDSRCYRVRPSAGRIAQWSHDQNLAAELLASGVISPADAETHPGRHILTEVVGGEKEPRAEIESGDTLEADEILLLCSDGLIRVVSEKEIGDALGPSAAEPTLQARAEQLLDLANQRGSPDNVGIVIVRVTPRT